MRKRYFTLALSILLISGFWAWPKVQLFLIECQLQHHYKKCTGKRISYTSIYLRPDRLSIAIENPRLFFEENCEIFGANAEITFERPLSWFKASPSFNFNIEQAKLLVQGSPEVNCTLKATFNKVRKIFFTINFENAERNLDIIITRSKRNILVEAKGNHVPLELGMAFLGSYFPKVPDLSIQKGSLNGYLACLFTKNQLEEVQADLYLNSIDVDFKNHKFEIGKVFLTCGKEFKNQISIENLNLITPRKEMIISFPKVTGNFHEVTKVNDLEITLSEGSIELMNIPYMISHVDAFLKYSEGTIVEGSKGIFNLEGAKGEFSINGDITKPNIALKLNGSFLDLQHTLSTTGVGESLLTKFENDVFELTSTVTHNESEFNFNGSLIVSEKDQINFNGQFKSWIPEFSFSSNEVPLNKYLALFLYSESPLEISGDAQLNGNYKDNVVILMSDSIPLVLEGTYFKLDLKGNRFNGVFDFSEMTSSLDLSFFDGSYLEKHSGILFNQLKGLLHFQPGFLKIDNLQTYAEEIFFSGNLSVDLNNYPTGTVEIDVYNHTFGGKVSDAQKFLSRFSSHNFLIHLPLDGRINCGKEGAHYHFSLSPNECKIQASIQGEISEGNLRKTNQNLGLYDLSLGFNYDYQSNTLNLNNLHGTVLLGKPGYYEELYVASDGITFTDFTHNISEFDIWIGDRSRDILRFVGKTAPLNEKDIGIYLNPKITHFGVAHPRAACLTLEDWTKIKSINFSSDFDLNEVSYDLQRLSRLNFDFVPESILNAFRELKTISGNCSISFLFEDDVLKFSTSVNHLKLDEIFIDSFSLIGEQKDKSLSIEHCQIDDLSLSADICHEKDKLTIDFLGMQYGHLILSGCGGEYFINKNKLEISLDLMEIDLAHVNDLKMFHSFISKYNPKGKVRLQGKLQVDFFTGKSIPKFSGVVDSSFQALEIQGIVFHSAEHVNCEFNSESGFHIHSFETSIGEPSLPVTINEVAYNTQNKELLVSGSFSGSDFSFKDCHKDEDPDLLCLEGVIKFDPLKSGPLFFEKSWSFYNSDVPTKDEMILTGRLYWDKKLNKWNSFIGNLTGAGLFENLVSQIKVSTDSVDLLNLQMKNSTSKFHSDILRFIKKNGKWFCSTPFIGGNIQAKNEAFAMKNIEIRDLEGCVENLESFTGEGQLHFINNNKMSLMSLLALTQTKENENLKKEMLAPSSGNIFFQIKDGKLILKKLKDVYSSDHSIKFYISKDVHCYINLKGEVDLQFGLHPYNMFLKLPEIASLKIKGNLKKPIFSFVSSQ